MSAQRGLYLILLLTAAGVGCGESPTGPSDEPVTFSGRLLDYVTQAPIAGAPLSFSLQSVAGTLNPSSTTTTADGAYTITVPRTGEYVIRIDARFLGIGVVNGRAYRGELYSDTGTCASRYGLVLDDRTLRPISGALVRLTSATTTTGEDGWYRLDFPCPDVGFPGGTTVITVTRAPYENRTMVVGRGLSGVSRLDITMTRAGRR
jgi:hypothetical protein